MCVEELSNHLEIADVNCEMEEKFDCQNQKDYFIQARGEVEGE